jgi:TonB family protein
MEAALANGWSGRMPARGISTLFIAGLSALSIVLPKNSAAQSLQSQAAFETAIRDESTSPYVVLITAIDDRTGQADTGCTGANLLLGAIYLEKWGSYDKARLGTNSMRDEAEKIALENTAHVFHFSNQSALDNVLPFRYPEACAAIKTGVRARIGDRSGQILLGPFVEGPSVILSSCPAPVYPSEDRKDGNESSPNIALLVGPDGTLKESKVADSSGSTRIDEAVRAALSACKFSPRTIDGEPMPEASWMTIRIGRRAVWR